MLKYKPQSGQLKWRTSVGLNMDCRARISGQRKRSSTTWNLSNKEPQERLPACFPWATRLPGTASMLALCSTFSRGAVLMQDKPPLWEGVIYQMLLKSTLHTSFHLEVTPSGLALTHNGQWAFLGVTVTSPLLKEHSTLLPWCTEGQAGCLAVLNFGMWLRGPGRLLVPHLQYLRFLVLRTTRSPVEPLQAKGHLHKPGVNTHWSHAWVCRCEGGTSGMKASPDKLFL